MSKKQMWRERDWWEQRNAKSRDHDVPRPHHLNRLGSDRTGDGDADRKFRAGIRSRALPIKRNLVDGCVGGRTVLDAGDPGTLVLRGKRVPRGEACPRSQSIGTLLQSISPGLHSTVIAGVESSGSTFCYRQRSGVSEIIRNSLNCPGEATLRDRSAEHWERKGDENDQYGTYGHYFNNCHASFRLSDHCIVHLMSG